MALDLCLRECSTIGGARRPPKCFAIRFFDLFVRLSLRLISVGLLIILLLLLTCTIGSRGVDLLLILLLLLLLINGSRGVDLLLILIIALSLEYVANNS